MNAALVAAESVDFVYDHGVNRAEHLPCARAGQHQVQRLGCGDQDVRRLLEHLLTKVSRRIARAHSHVQRRQRLVQSSCDGADPRQGRAQIALDVIVQRFKRGYIKQPNPRTGTWVGRRPVAPSCHAPSRRLCRRLIHRAGWRPLGGRQLTVDLVDAPQKGGDCLARPGRRQDETMLASLDRRPTLGLRRRRRTEGFLKPDADGPRETIERIGHAAPLGSNCTGQASRCQARTGFAADTWYNHSDRRSFLLLLDTFQMACRRCVE